MAEKHSCCSCCGSRSYPEREIFFVGSNLTQISHRSCQRLAQECGFYYYDEQSRLPAHLAQATQSTSLTAEPAEILPVLAGLMPFSCESELAHAAEILPYILAELAALPGEDNVLAVSAVFMPELMRRLGVHPSRYLWLSPQEEFWQAEQLRLEQQICRQQAAAELEDLRSAAAISERLAAVAEQLGYGCLRTSCGQTDEELCSLMKEHFLLTQV